MGNFNSSVRIVGLPCHSGMSSKDWKVGLIPHPFPRAASCPHSLSVIVAGGPAHPGLLSSGLLFPCSTEGKKCSHWPGAGDHHVSGAMVRSLGWRPGAPRSSVCS